MLVTRAEEWCVEAESPEEARELLATGAGYRCHLGDCVHVEVESVECLTWRNHLAWDLAAFQAFAKHRFASASDPTLSWVLTLSLGGTYRVIDQNHLSSRGVFSERSS